jgi:hypothetical protein
MRINVSVVPSVHGELAAGLRGGGIDAGGFQSLEVFRALIGVYNMEGSVPALEPFPDKWKQHAVFFFGIVEEGTDVTLVAELRASEVNRGGDLRLHGELLDLMVAASILTPAFSHLSLN